MADWYDSRLSHVDPRDTWHKTSGRIYRIVADEKPKSSAKFSRLESLTNFDLTQWPSSELIELFSHPNKFFQQTAVRVLAERKDTSVAQALRSKLFSDSVSGRLQALWALYRLGQFSEDDRIAALKHPDPNIRRWTVRLIGDDRNVSSGVARQLVLTTKSEADLAVRTQLASSAKRLPAAIAIPILQELIQFDVDADDIHQGLLVWWAFEAHAVSNAEEIAELVSNCFEKRLVQKFVAGRLVQRWAMNEPKPHWDAVVHLFDRSESVDQRTILVQAVREALAGKTKAVIPTPIQERLTAYYRESKQSDLPMLLKTGDQAAIKEALKKAGDSKTPIAERIELIELLGQSRVKEGVSLFSKIMAQSGTPSLQRTALLALAAYDDDGIGATICKQLHTTLSAGQGLQQTALQVLAGRRKWVSSLLEEVEASRFNAKLVSNEVVEQMRVHNDEDLQERIRKIWGTTRKTPEELNAKIAEVHGLLRNGTGEIESGRALFQKKCGTCHTLFGEGGRVGPNLTGYERDNLAFMVPAVVDPSAGIREEFTQFKVLTQDGRVVVGLLEQQDNQTVTIRRADNQVERIARDDVESLQASPQSLMPDGLLNDLSESQIRDLFAYLTTRSYFSR